MTEPSTDWRSSEPYIVRNGIGVQIMETLAVGAFLTALAVQLGAANWMIGALAAIPHLSQIAQLPALWTVEQVRQRRRIYIASGMVARPMLLVIALAAVLLAPSLAIWVILVSFTIRYVAGAYLSCSWNSWMRDLVPDREMGQLFGNRQRKMIGVSIVLSLVAAFFVDMWPRTTGLDVTYAYAVVYFLAFLGGTYSVIAARHIYEPAMVPVMHEAFGTQLRAPLKDRNYRRLMVFLGSWNLAVNLAAPFFTVYMLKRLEYDLVIVIGLATLSQIAAFLTVRNWGRIADRVSNKTVLRTCCPMFIAAIFLWTFTTLPDKHAFTLPLLVLLHTVMGFATTGVNLATGNIALKLAPKGDSTAYLATSALINAVAAGGAALAGGITIDLISSWQLSLTVNWQSEGSDIAFGALHLSHWDFFFCFAVALGLYSLHRLSLVNEEGELANVQVLGTFLNSTRQTLRNLSTIAGLRDASDFPLDKLLKDPDKEGESEDDAKPPR